MDNRVCVLGQGWGVSDCVCVCVCGGVGGGGGLPKQIGVARDQTGHRVGSSPVLSGLSGWRVESGVSICWKGAGFKPPQLCAWTHLFVSSSICISLTHTLSHTHTLTRTHTLTLTHTVTLPHAHNFNRLHVLVGGFDLAFCLSSPDEGTSRETCQFSASLCLSQPLYLPLPLSTSLASFFLPLPLST